MTMKHEAIIQYRHSHKRNCLQTKEVNLLKYVQIWISCICVKWKKCVWWLMIFSRAPLGYRFALGFAVLNRSFCYGCVVPYNINEVHMYCFRQISSFKWLNIFNIVTVQNYINSWVAFIDDDYVITVYTFQTKSKPWG